MSRARKLLRSFEGKYLGKMVYAELSEGIGSTTEDPRIIAAPETADQGRRAVRFAGIPALVRGGRRYSGSWDPVPVLVAEGGEQKRCQKQNQESNDYPWLKRFPRRLFSRNGTRRQANFCRGGG